MKLMMTVLVLALSGAAAMAQGGAAADAAKCQSCHDTAGPSTIPSLAGQRADYILLRLKEFHNPATQSPHATYFMWDIATGLGETKAKALAAYFAAMKPAPATPSSKSARAGEAFYHGEGGCQACHGDKGEGGKDAAPRLAGQHNMYLKRQLESFGLGVRYQPQMVSHSLRLTPDQIGGLVAWLGGD